ncbi:reverse transcriptase domain-containing protein [Tanacetum coccineum]
MFKNQDKFANQLAKCAEFCWTSLCNNFKNSASTSNSGTLPGQTITNPRQQINAITTRSSKTLEKPSTPLVPTPDVSIPSKESEQNPETSTEKVQNLNLENTHRWSEMRTIKPSANIAVLEEMFKRLRLEIGLKDGSLSKCKVQTNVLEKLEDPGKFLIPYDLQELNRTSALADSGASINLLPHSIYKKLRLEALTPTHMTLKLANHSITHPMGIAKDVVVRVDGFTFLADFVVVNFEPDPRVPIILGRPSYRPRKVLIALYEEKLTLRVGKEELVYYAINLRKIRKRILFMPFFHISDFSNDDPCRAVTTNTLLLVLLRLLNSFAKFDDNFKSSNVNPLFEEKDKDVEIKSSILSTYFTGESEFEADLEKDFDSSGN